MDGLESCVAGLSAWLEGGRRVGMGVMDGLESVWPVLVV